MNFFNPIRLKEIRIIQNLTLEQVAISLDLTKQMVSKYETGMSTPPNETLIKMARLFRAPLAYFSKPSVGLNNKCSALFFRTTTNTSSKEVESARTSNQWSYEIIDVIDRLWGLPNANLPSFEASCSVIERARLLREHWGLGTAPIDDLISILEANGIFVTVVSSARMKTDGYSQIINDVPVIVINENKGSAVRQRFSIAHELGHLILHQNLSESEYRLQQELCESEANLFANYFLLSPTGFDGMVVSADLNQFIELKKTWKVSLGAMMRHCIDSGIMSEEVERTKNSYYRKFGRATEPLDDVMIPEQPTLLANTLSTHTVNKDSFDSFFNTVSLPLSNIENLTGLGDGYWRDFYGDGSEWNTNVSPDLQPYYQQLTLFDLEV